jgi:ribosomal protein L37E
MKELHKCGIVSFHMETRDVSHCCGLAIYIKRYPKAKEEEL